MDRYFDPTSHVADTVSLALPASTSDGVLVASYDPKGKRMGDFYHKLTLKERTFVIQLTRTYESRIAATTDRKIAQKLANNRIQKFSAWMTFVQTCWKEFKKPNSPPLDQWEPHHVDHCVEDAVTGRDEMKAFLKATYPTDPIDGKMSGSAPTVLCVVMDRFFAANGNA
jgi:hypothetical protein